MPLAVELMDASGSSQFESVLAEVCAAEGHNKHVRIIGIRAIARPAPGPHTRARYARDL
jgi:hypothetical protein